MSTLVEEPVDPSHTASTNELTSLAISAPDGGSDLSEENLARAIDELVWLLLQCLAGRLLTIRKFQRINNNSTIIFNCRR